VLKVLRVLVLRVLTVLKVPEYVQKAGRGDRP